MSAVRSGLQSNVTPEEGSENSHLFKNVAGRKAPQYRAALAASFSVFSMGNAIAWTSQISPKLLNGEFGFPINEDQLGWIGGLVSLGAAFLALVIGPICDLFGRKTTMLALVAPLTLGWCLVTWAINLEMLYAGRFLTGMAGGAFCVLAPLYSNEIAQKEIRGSLGCFTQLMISFGIFFDVVLSKFLTIKQFSICCLIVPLIFGLIFVLMPETPVFYLRKGRRLEAKSALKHLRGRDYDVEVEILLIISTLKENRSNILHGLAESFGRTATKKAFVIVMGLMSFRILCGIDAITAYASYIFQNATRDFDPEIGTIILMSLQTAAAILQSFVVDRVGRRILLLTSEIVMAFCVSLVGLSLLLKDRNLIEETLFVYFDYLPLVALCVFCMGYSLGLGPISFMMTSEILPQEVKSSIASFSTFVSWMLAFTVAKTFFTMKESWGADVTFFIYGGLSFLGAIFMFFVVPETKGKSYEEIQNLLGNK